MVNVSDIYVFGMDGESERLAQPVDHVDVIVVEQYREYA